MTHEKLANDIVIYKLKYGLKDTVVPNFIARMFPASVSQQDRIHGIGSVSGDAQSTQNCSKASVKSVTVPADPMVVTEVKRSLTELWPEEGGREKLIENLSQTHFPAAIDPFNLCRELLSMSSWSAFRVPKESIRNGAVIEAYALWFGSLDSDKRKEVFERFMKQPIIEACRSGNAGLMCRLLTFLNLFEQFENEEDLFLIPAQLQRRTHFVADYLNGCGDASRQRFACKLDALLAAWQIDIAIQCKKYHTNVVTHDIIAKDLDFYRHKYDFPDLLFPNLMAGKVDREGSETKSRDPSVLLSPEGLWKHLSPPQRHIKLYKMQL